ncbi:shock factor protein [Seminavis robusta]|uniref:Shock factor protein n=1 Tax=Seminavis robusta TaxID=568900 RepID=A0A9N8DH89_9STRA|nr:shock factor protein [Seminavis robusta]|eukprot:Sro125_g060340.1 shock factor protein (644) ;mRNA; f:82582-84798
MDDMEGFGGGGGMKRPHDDDGAFGGGGMGGGLGEEDYLSENEHQTSKSRGTVTVQIFIKKTFKMINDCDSKIACWTPEGDKFVIKDPEMFAQQVIPQYFDHNKFSSFTRQLNFYKFTREQSKAIKKSDSSAEIARHQTFYHKFFQRGRPDLLKHLQRSRKTSSSHDNNDDVHPHSQGAKKPKLVSSGGGGDDKGFLGELARRMDSAEVTIKNLQQENATLSFAVQKLQKEGEMKQRALVALQEQIRMSEINMTQSLQQQQSQLLQFTQPLPFDRESSLSGVNASTLMRFLSIDPKLQNLMSVENKLQRLTTPPFRNLTASAQFGAAAAAENLVQQATENAAAAAAARSNTPTIPRHPRMKGASEGLTGAPGASISRHQQLMKGGAASAAEALAGAGSAGGGGGGATLPRHSKFKSSSAGEASGADGGGASLPRHNNFKSSSESSPPAAAAPGPGGAALPRHPKMRRQGGPPGASGITTSTAGTMAMLAQNGFLDNNGKTSGLEESIRQSLEDNKQAAANADANNKNEALFNLQQQMLAARSGGVSPSPAGASALGFSSAALAASIQNNMNATAQLRGLSGGLGQGGDLGSLSKESSIAALRLGASGFNLERELSNIGGDPVSREESFTLASLLDLSRGNTQQI